MAPEAADRPCIYQALPASWRFRPDEVHLFAFELSAPAPILDRLGESLSPPERDQRSRFAFPRLGDQYAVAHGTMRAVLARCLDQPGQRLRIEAAKGGKPWLPDHPSLQFNLSHSGDMALLGVALAHPIGVDIEAVRAMPDAAAIATRFFAAGECDALAALPEGERTPAFFRCWTRKEAYVKALGTGLATPLDSFRVSLDAQAGFVSSGEESRWTLRDASLSAAYAAAVCMPNGALPLHFWRIAPGMDGGVAGSVVGT